MAIIVEAFHGGSHKQLVDLLCNSHKFCKVYTAPARKFPWRLRTSALYFANVIESHPDCKVLFATSTLNLAELCGLRPDLGRMTKVLYFHENQLVYPVQKTSDLDFQLGYAQITSSLVADLVVFNSRFNRDSFLDNVEPHLKLMPDMQVKGVRKMIESKCHVLYYPLQLEKLSLAAAEFRSDSTGASAATGAESEVAGATAGSKCLVTSDACTEQMGKPASTLPTADTAAAPPSLPTADTAAAPPSLPPPDHQVTSSEAPESSSITTMSECSSDVSQSNAASKYRPLHIIWPHRWEHDKNPEVLFAALKVLVTEGQKFCVSIIGEAYHEVPDVFMSSREWLKPHIVHWGYLKSRSEYLRALQSADVVVSTAMHEFFGVAMLEAVHSGCYPLCPNRLVYPEIFPKECLYSTDNQLTKKLRTFCRFPHLAKVSLEIDLERFDWDKTLKQAYTDLLSGKEPSWSVPG